MRRLVVAAVLAVAIGAPILELFDRWDPTIEQGGGDTEANAVVVALCVGVAFAIGGTIAACIRAVRLSSSQVAALPRFSRDLPPLTLMPERTGRAPTPLRI